MAESHVVSGLVSKRSELAGLIQHHQNEVHRIAGELDHLDATIKLFDPHYDLRGIRPRAQRRLNPHFKNGESHRMVLDAMREAGASVTTRFLTEALIARKGLTLDKPEFESTQKLVIGVLRRLEKRGIVKEAGRNAQNSAFLWMLP